MFFKRPLILIALLCAGAVGIAFFVFLNRNQEPAYDSVTASRSNVIQEVSVTGKVRAAQSVNLSFEKTGTVALVPVRIGQHVETGQVLARLSTQDAEKQARDAQVALEAAQLELQKRRAEHQQFLRGDTLHKGYEDGLAVLASLYDDFEPILDALDDIYFGSNFSNSSEANIQYYANYLQNNAAVFRLTRLYAETETLYENGIADYRIAERGSGEARLRAIQSGYNLAIKAAETVKTGRDLVREFQDTVLTGTTVHQYQTTIDGHANDLASYATSTNSYLEDLLTITNTINAELDTADTYPLDIVALELAVQQKENALQDAKENVEKYYIITPVDAVITKQDLTIGESVTANTPVITIISKAQFEIEAHIPEADIAKIATGNTATVTLDAYGPDQVFKAMVTEIDPAETIIEGVTTYRTTLQFPEPDNRIRSGMTADVTIATAQKENVIAVPQRAIVRQNGNRFVRVVQANGAIEQVQVETGLQGSDGRVEIISGLTEGDQVITFFPE